MLEYSLTTERCVEVLEDLRKTQGWTLARVAQILDAPVDYVRRIHSGVQSFQLTDIDLLAKQAGLQSYELIFNPIKRDKLSPKKREFYDLAVKQVELHRTMHEILNPKAKAKPLARKGTRTTAAGAKTSTKPAARRAFVRS